jgi:glycosyltransferase involved in cell wall biosynthesis
MSHSRGHRQLREVEDLPPASHPEPEAAALQPDAVADRAGMLHVITGLNTGGAEAMLAKLLERQSADRHPVVLSLMTPGATARRIRARNVPICTLDLREGAPSAAALVRLRRVIRATRPQLIQGWMHHGALAATIGAAMLRPSPPVIWNVRHSLVDIAHEKRGTRTVLRVLAALSSRPSAIVYNSSVAARQYGEFGFDPSRATVIPNGFDCESFRPSPQAARAQRQRFAVEDGVRVVGMVSRCHPMKDPGNLAAALRRVREAGHDVHLLLVGPGYDRAPDDMVREIRASLPENRVTLAPERHDLPAWLPGLDVLALASAWGEGFPNILGEAMLSGVPCVATDVGDRARILGAAGRVVPPRDPARLASAILRLLELGGERRKRLGQAARDRVIRLFSLDRVESDYQALYDRALSARPGVLSNPLLGDA